MLGKDAIVHSVATMHNFATVSLVRISYVVIIVIESIGGAILKEEAALSLAQARYVLLIGIRQIKVEDAEVAMVKLEVT